MEYTGIHNHRSAWSGLRLLIAAVCCMVAIVAQAAENRLEFPRSASAAVGIVVRDLATGEDLTDINADKLMAPASIMKCVTSAAVLLDNRENECFATEVAVTGEVTPDSILIGDLIVCGVGDPTIESSRFPEYQGITDSIASRLQRAGIRKIAGYIDIDSVGFAEQGPGKKWELEDLKWYYGAGLFPLNYRDNTVGADRAMKNPARTFTADLKRTLLARGIEVGEQDVVFGEVPLTLIYTHRSPMHASVMRDMMVESNNLFAESMLRILSPEGTLADALKHESELLGAAGLDTCSLQAYDGSGLTRANRLTPAFMADLLTLMAHSPKAQLYTSFFPRAGEEGTVKKLLRDTRLAGRIVLKSGSMKGVLCYAGYRIADDGRPTHAIVVMVNSHSCPTARLRNAIGDFLLREFPK